VDTLLHNMQYICMAHQKRLICEDTVCWRTDGWSTTTFQPVHCGNGHFDSGTLMSAVDATEAVRAVAVQITAVSILKQRALLAE
jgi:hypothetical protein